MSSRARVVSVLGMATLLVLGASCAPGGTASPELGPFLASVSDVDPVAYGAVRVACEDTFFGGVETSDASESAGYVVCWRWEDVHADPTTKLDEIASASMAERPEILECSAIDSGPRRCVGYTPSLSLAPLIFMIEVQPGIYDIGFGSSDVDARQVRESLG